MIDQIRYRFDCGMWGTPKDSSKEEVSPAPEPNFNHTLLYSYIKWRRWEAALDRLTHFPHEASRWIFDKSDDGSIEKYLPLHLVCRETTRQLQLVETLINVYPDAVREVDHAGRLPLHHFCLGITHNPTYNFFQPDADDVKSILVLLLSVFPEAMYSRDAQDQATPMKIITDAINRKGRSAVTDAIVSTLTDYHCLLEQQKDHTEEPNPAQALRDNSPDTVEESLREPNVVNDTLRTASISIDSSSEQREDKTTPVPVEADEYFVMDFADERMGIPTYPPPTAQYPANGDDMSVLLDSKEGKWSTPSAACVDDDSEQHSTRSGSHMNETRSSSFSDSEKSRDLLRSSQSLLDGDLADPDEDIGLSSQLPPHLVREISMSESRNEDVFQDALEEIKVTESFAPREGLDRITMFADEQLPRDTIEMHRDETHSCDSALAFGEEVMVGQEESSPNDVGVLQAKLSALEVAHRDATEKLQLLSTNEVTYKSIIQSLQSELHKQTADASELLEFSNQIANLTEAVIRMKAIKEKDAQTISELQNEVARAGLETDAYKIAVKGLKKDAKKRGEKAVKNSRFIESCRQEIADLKTENLALRELNEAATSREAHLESTIREMQEKLQQLEANGEGDEKQDDITDSDECYRVKAELLQDQVTAMESKEMTLLFRISELEAGHSAALLQLQSVVQCEKEIEILKAEVAIAVSAAKDTSTELEESKMEFEREVGSLQGIIADLRNQVTTDQDRIKDLAATNARCQGEISRLVKASEDLQAEKMQLELSATPSTVDIRDENEALTKQRNDVKELEISQETVLRKLEELSAQKDMLEQQNAQLQKEIGGLTSLSPDLEIENASLKSQLMELSGNMLRLEILEDRNRNLKETLTQSRNEYYARMEELMMENDELRRLNEELMRRMNDQGTDSSYTTQSLEDENSALKRRVRHLLKAQRQASRSNG